MNTQDAFYTATYTGSEVCTALNGIFDLGLDKKYYLPKDLNKNKKNFKLRIPYNILKIVKEKQSSYLSEFASLFFYSSVENEIIIYLSKKSN